jgi:UDP-N-acetylglucosamine transferase subunit ALG13
MKKNKALFAMSSLWLGHATRTLVVVNHFLDAWFEIDIISFWNALNFLKTELWGKKVNFIELVDYPPLERWKWASFYYYLFIDLIKTSKIIKSENRFVRKIQDKYDFIFSDWRYWVYSKKIPSFLLSHQLAFIMQKWLSFFSRLADYFNYKHFKNFDHVFIPDYKNIDRNLAWNLSHPNWINNINHTFIWVLSSISGDKNENTNNIDYLFTISGYLQDSKESFVNTLIEQAKKLSWKKVFVLWDTKNNYVKELENDITIYSFVSWETRKQLFENAKIIISRTWYTTIMDLVELWKKAILFPTPNQTEQEYLAEFLKENNYYVIWEKDIDLEHLVNKVEKSRIFDTIEKTKVAIEKIELIISKYTKW